MLAGRLTNRAGRSSYVRLLAVERRAVNRLTRLPDGDPLFEQGRFPAMIEARRLTASHQGRAHMTKLSTAIRPPRALAEFTITPDPEDSRLFTTVAGIDHTGARHRDAGRDRAPADVVSQRPRDRHADDHRRSSGIAGGRLSAQSGHAHAAGRNHGHRSRTRYRNDRRAHEAADRLRGQAQEEGADVRLRAGHRVRRSDGGVRQRPSGARRAGAHQLALSADPQDQHAALALPEDRAPSMAACCARAISRCSTWKMSGATMRSTRSPAI